MKKQIVKQLIKHLQSKAPIKGNTLYPHEILTFLNHLTKHDRITGEIDVKKYEHINIKHIHRFADTNILGHFVPDVYDARERGKLSVNEMLADDKVLDGIITFLSNIMKPLEFSQLNYRTFYTAVIQRLADLDHIFRPIVPLSSLVLTDVLQTLDIDGDVNILDLNSRLGELMLASYIYSIRTRKTVKYIGLANGVKLDGLLKMCRFQNSSIISENFIDFAENNNLLTPQLTNTPPNIIWFNIDEYPLTKIGKDLKTDIVMYIAAIKKTIERATKYLVSGGYFVVNFSDYETTGHLSRKVEISKIIKENLKKPLYNSPKCCILNSNNQDSYICSYRKI